jgi:hypothetical protein
MNRKLSAAAAFTLVLFCASSVSAGRKLFQLGAQIGAMPVADERNSSMIDLVKDFIEGDGGFSPLAGLLGYQGSLNYLGIADALVFDVQNFGSTVRMTIPSIGTDITFIGSDPDDVADQIEDWFEKDDSKQWADFLRATNELSQLALLSGNPKSTVALMGNSPYRKYGYDDSRSRFGFGETETQRVAGLELRIDARAGSVNTRRFDSDLAAFDGAITLGGEFGRLVGLAFSIIGQYRNYSGTEMADLGLELALPLTFLRPDTSDYFWQLTPFFQAAGGASIDAAAGGLFLGGGVVNAIGLHRSCWDIQMSNEIAYYGGIPINDVGGYDFDTKLSQLLFKNGLEATVWFGAGFYADVGVHFTNFAVDDAAVPWYATPTIGVGWQAGRWLDLRIAYEADVDNKDYRAHNAVLKLDFLF